MKTTVRVGVGTCIVIAGLAAGSSATRAGDTGDTEAALIASLSTSRHTLLDGVRAAASAPAVALSAKFEDEGKGLSLSVYVAGKSLAADADDNLLEELAGSPTAADWKPAAEVFKDVEHVARSAEQLTLLRTSKLSLVELLAKAQAAEPGTIYSATPRVRDGRGVLDVRLAVDGKPVALVLDLSSGAALERLPARVPPPEPTLVGQGMPEPVLRGGARWIGTAPPSLRSLAAQRVVVVATNSYLCETTDEAWSWPRLLEWLDANGASGLSVVGVVGEAESASDVEAYVSTRKIAYPVLHDPRGENAKAWHAGRTATAFVLDRDDKVVWQGSIGPQGDAKGCEKAIRAQLSERAGTLSR